MLRSRINSRARLTRFAYSSGGIGAMAFVTTSYGSSPLGPAIGPAINHVKKVLLDRRGQGTAPAVANSAIVNLDNRCHFRAGAREKHLVGRQHVVPGKQLFTHFDITCPSKPDHRI